MAYKHNIVNADMFQAKRLHKHITVNIDCWGETIRLRVGSEMAN